MRMAGLVAGVALAAVGLVVGVAAVGGAQGPQRGPEAGATARPMAPDERAIRDRVAEFVRAFNAADAPGVAALFAADARLTGTHGNVLEGRAAIEQDFAETFRAQPGLTIEVVPESVRLVGPDSAVEEGVAKVTPKEGGNPEVSRYSAVHVKRDGKWLQASVHE